MKLVHWRVSQFVAVLWLVLFSTASFAVSWVENAPGVNGFSAVDKVTWRDSKGLERELYFARSYPNPIVPRIMGYVTRITWQPDATAARIIAEEDPSGINASNAQGWGTSVMHMHWLQYGGVNPYFGSGFSATTNKRDGFDFVQGPLFLGPSHLIFRVTYKQYTSLVKGGVDTRKSVNVTIDWFIADGLDHVIYAITLDASRDYLSDSVAFLNNSLAPYSLVTPASWKSTSDWAGGRDGPDGQSFGDFKTFLSTDMANWTYGGVNTVPFTWQWVTPARGRGDAEAAYVQTETYAQKQAGEGFANGQNASGSHLPVSPELDGQEYAFQMNYFDGYQSKRLTWGTRFGSLYGGGGATPGYQNYSLALHLGKFSDRGVPALIQETEGIHNGELSVRALTGSLLNSGPEGSGNPTTHSYVPRGYNHVYRTWEISSSGNVAAIAFDVGNGNYKRPVFVVHGYTGNSLSAVAVTLNGAAVPSSAFTASLDAPADKLYVTLLSTLSGSNVIRIQGGVADAGVADAGVAACGWDPRVGSAGCAQGEWWLEFSTPNTAGAMQVEITTSTGTRTVALPSRFSIGGGLVKFTGSPSSRVATGAVVRVKVTQLAAAGGQQAQTRWFAYLQNAPVLDCMAACTPTCAAGACGTANGCGGTCACAGGLSCVSNACACVPSCGGNRCGSDGCGGSCGACGSGETCAGGQCSPGCVAPWDPQWAQQGGSGAWWAEFKVASGGALTSALVVETVATGALHPLSYNYGRWTGGVTNLVSGSQVVLRATNALGATAKTMPFRYLVDLNPVTNPRGGTAAPNTTCQPLSRGKVTFSFDDSGSSQPTIALPLMQRYGVKGTFFVVPQWHNWVSVAQSMLADGHEFAGHGMTHTTLTGLSAQQLDDELRLSRAWIQTYIGGTVDSFATPSAAFNDTVVNAVKGYYGSHRGGEEDLNFVGTDVYRLKSHFMYNTSTIAGVCAQIQQAAAQKGWLFLTFHDFTNNATGSQGFTMPAAIFEGILACATATPGIDVVTARQATAALRCGSPP